MRKGEVQPGNRWKSIVNWGLVQRMPDALHVLELWLDHTSPSGRERCVGKRWRNEVKMVIDGHLECWEGFEIGLLLF